MKVRQFARSLFFNTFLCWMLMLAPVMPQEGETCDTVERCVDEVLAVDENGDPASIRSCETGEIISKQPAGATSNQNSGDGSNYVGGGEGGMCNLCDMPDLSSLNANSFQNPDGSYGDYYTEKALMYPEDPLVMLPEAPNSAPAYTISPKLFQSISLGKDSSGFDLGNFVVSADPNDTSPIHVSDVKLLLKRSAGILDMNFHLVAEDPDHHQVYYTTPDALFKVESWMASGSLRVSAFDLAHTTPDAEGHAEPNPGAPMFMDIHVERTMVNGQAGIRVSGFETVNGGTAPLELTYVADHAANTGNVQTIEENGVRTQITDSYVQAADDHDGWYHVRERVFSKPGANPAAWVETRRITETWRTLFNGREVLVESLEADNGGSARRTQFFYDEVLIAAETVNKAFGKVAARLEHDGSWEAYQHDSNGLRTRVYRPWQDGPAHPLEADASNCWMKETYYNPMDDYQSHYSTISVLGVPVASEQVLHVQDNADPELWTKTVSLAESDGSTVTRYLRDPDGLRRTLSVTKYEGFITEVRYDRKKGRLSADGHHFIEDASGTLTASVTTEGIIPGGQVLAGKSKRTTRVTQVNDSVVLEYEEVATQSSSLAQAGFQRFAGRSYTYDDQSRLTGIYLLDGTPQETHSYTATTHSVTDAEGVTTVLELEAGSGRVLARVKSGASHVSEHGTHRAPEVRQESSLAEPAADGAVLETITRSGALEGQPNLTSSTTRLRDSVGRLMAETDEQGRTTSYAYADFGRTITEILPSGATRIRRRYLDGRVKSITGNAQPAEFHVHSVPWGDAGHKLVLTTISYLDETTPAAQKVITHRYPEGETVGESTLSLHPVGGHAMPATGWFNGYWTNSAHPDFRQRLDGVREMMSYNALGEMEVIGIPETMSNLNPASMDVYTETKTAVVQEGGLWFERTIVRRLTTPGNPDAALVTTTWRRLGTGAPFVRTLQPDGTEVVVSTSFDRSHAARTVTRTVTRPGGSPLVSTQLYVNGLLMAETEPGLNGAVTHAYDSLERRISTADPRHGTVQWNYLADGRLNWAKDAGNRQTSYSYHPSTGAGAGLLKTVTYPDGTTTTYDYDVQGRVTLQAGTSGYPVGYEYDAWGKLAKMKTWRDPQGNADETTWLNDPFLGVLEKTDAAGQTVRYDYGQGGRLTSRLWARGEWTNYFYDFAGRQVNSSDGSSYSFDRLGRPSVISSPRGMRTFVYQGPGGAISQETIEEQGLTLIIEHGYDSQGRRNALRVKAPSSGGTLSETTYGYDDQTGRLASISHGGSTATYDWSSTVGGLSAGISYSGAGLTGIRTPDAEGRLDKIAWELDDADVLSHDYTLDERGRRTRATREDGTHWDYGYNDRGEVTAAAHERADNAALPGRDFSYAFDAIGNRVTSSVAFSQPPPQTSVYTSNPLNQYTQISRSNPLRRIVQGLAHPEATVEVRLDGPAGQSRTVARVEPNGAGFMAEAEADTALAGVWRQVVVEASRPGVGVNGGPVTTKRTGWLFFPPQNETLVYDADGNLTEDARWLYTWDGENRLTVMEEKAIANASPGATPPARKRLEFGYDHQGRRVSKQVYEERESDGVPNWAEVGQKRFVYDGWNLIAEMDVGWTNGNLEVRNLRSYAWGYDLSGTEQGAGGVGGLVLVKQRSSTVNNGQQPSTSALAPCYDGNGNILAYMDCATGAVVQRMEYDAFGSELTLDSVLNGGRSSAREVPFRFSTKYTDAETNLSYYGYRYYSAEMGRWFNRDPIAEQGGVNLYGMVGNDTINRLDLLGMSDCECKTVDSQGRWRDSRGRFTTPKVFANYVADPVHADRTHGAATSFVTSLLEGSAQYAMAANYANAVAAGEFQCSQQLTVEAKKKLNPSSLANAKPCKYCCEIRLRFRTQELSGWVVYALESASLKNQSCDEVRNISAFNPVGILTLYYAPH